MSALLQVVAALSQVGPGHLPHTAANKDSITSIREILFAIIGAMALLVIVVSGFRYIVSDGDAQKTVKARNGVIYALVGLVIAVTANAIVAFIVKRVG
jgi:hypothetical protein